MNSSNKEQREKTALNEGTFSERELLSVQMPASDVNDEEDLEVKER